MEAHTKFDIRTAFVATAEHVSKIWDLFESFGLEVSVVASCSDGIVRHFDTRELLVRYENPVRTAITSLEIYGRSVDSSSTAEVSLGARYSAPISVSVRAEEEVLSSVRIQLTDILAGMKPWYSAVAVLDVSAIWVPLLLCLGLLFHFMSASDAARPALPFGRALVGLAAVLSMLGCCFAIISGVGWFRRRYFPISTFAIGQGAERYQRTDQVRWAVIIAFIVSVLASIVVTFVLSGVGLTSASNNSA